MASNMQNITIHFPLPSIKGKHPGGRLQRKSRLKKKQNKYRIDSCFSFSQQAFMSRWGSEEIDGEMYATAQFTFTRN